MKPYKYITACVLICLFLKEKGLAQSIFQCKCTSSDTKSCLKEDNSNERATIKATNLYVSLLKQAKISDTLVNISALKPCSSVSTFVAYYNESNGKRFILYPVSKSIINLDYPDWVTKGALLHAIVHLQQVHSGKNNAYRQELEADSITISILRKCGATSDESIQYLKITDSPNMPEYQSRVKSAYQAPPIASFTVNCSNGCVEPCKVSFSSTSVNVHPDTKYYWNNEKFNENMQWTKELWAGEYIMKLRVVNPDGQESEFQQTIIVKKGNNPNPPTARFTVNCSNNCVEPCKISFSSTSTNVLPNSRYFWNGKELGSKVDWAYGSIKAGEYVMKLRVVNPDGQKSEFQQTITVKKDKPYINPVRFGIQVGANYSPDYEFFSPRIGLTLSYHPDFWGIQAELNYVKRVSETYNFYSEYNQFWNDYDYYSSFSNYKIHNLELPLMLVIGRNREPKIGVNALIGASISYGVSGNVRYEEYTSFANGDEDYYSENHPIEFEYDDYQRTQIRGILGITIGNERFCWGGRVDAGIPGSQYFSPEISSYLMFKF